MLTAALGLAVLTAGPVQADMTDTVVAPVPISSATNAGTAAAARPPALVRSRSDASSAALPTTITLLSAGGRAPYRTTVTISGYLTATLTDAEGNQTTGTVDGQTVVLQRRLPDTTTWQRLAKAVTGDSGGYGGAFSFPVTAKQSAAYRVVFAGGTYGSFELAATDSSRVAVKVGRDLHDRAVVKKGVAYLRGNVDPGWGHRLVRLQRSTCASGCAWKAAGRDRTTPAGVYSLDLAARAGHDTYYRARVPAAQGFATSYSTVYVVSHA